MARVTVALPQRNYDVIIENGSLNLAGAMLHDIFGEQRRVFVVTVAPVRRRWGKKLLASLSKASFETKFVEMPDGERHKNLTTVETLAEKLVQLKADRSAAIIAFGGGVVGDVAGLLASVYMRAVDLVQIPTTVQAQLDAAIGGKTGVNLRSAKNLIGTFHQPRIVLADPDVLSTLPDREFRAGLYEALKCGVIGRPELFRKLEQFSPELLRRDASALEWIIKESVELKAEVVVADEREGGLRRVLNFGHTIGHALEAESKYRRFLHGEAVAWGMIAATHIATATGRLDHAAADQITSAILDFGPLPQVTARSRDILHLLYSDKKTRSGKLHFVLPREIGKVEIVNDVPDKIVLEAINQLHTH